MAKRVSPNESSDRGYSDGSPCIDQAKIKKGFEEKKRQRAVEDARLKKHLDVEISKIKRNAKNNDDVELKINNPKTGENPDGQFSGSERKNALLSGIKPPIKGSFINIKLHNENLHTEAALRFSIEKALKEFGINDISLDDFVRAVSANLAGHRIMMKAETPDVVAAPALPNFAPEFYQGLRGPENPPDFIRRVYAPWLGSGLARPHIKKLDRKLYDAINNWLSRPGNEWPADVDLPTKSQLIDQKVERLQAGEAIGEFTLREMQRMSAAIQRRRNNDKDS